MTPMGKQHQQWAIYVDQDNHRITSSSMQKHGTWNPLKKRHQYHRRYRYSQQGTPSIHSTRNTMSLKAFVKPSRTSRFKFWNITRKKLCLPIKKCASKIESLLYIILQILTRLLAHKQTSFIYNISPFSMGWTFEKSFVVRIQNKRSLSWFSIGTLHDSKKGFHHHRDVIIKTNIKTYWISYPLHITITSKYSCYKA